MDRVDQHSGAGNQWPCEIVPRAKAGTAVVAVGVALGLFGASGGATSGIAGTDLVGLAPLVVGVSVSGREGLAPLVGGIVGGALLGGAAGYLAHATLSVPLSQVGTAGMGAALGGGLGGLTYFVFVGEEDQEEGGVRVDMGREEDPEPRPADLFDDHPDPVLYVADEGGGPVVRAANAAYGETFDLPPAALSGVPLSEALRPAKATGSGGTDGPDADAGSGVAGGPDGDDVVGSDGPDADDGAGTDENGGDAGTRLKDALAAGDTVDRDLALATADGMARFRVRSVGNPADGYVLFTPVEPADRS